MPDEDELTTEEDSGNELMPEGKDKLLSKAAKWFTNAKDSKQQERKLWDMCLKFIDGHHWQEWRESAESWGDEPEGPSYRVRAVVNLARSYYRKEVGRLTKQRASLHAIPATNDADDQWKAGLADKVLLYHERENDLVGVDKTVKEWITAIGNSFGMVWWNPRRSGGLGDVEVSVLPPYEGYTYPEWATKLEECEVFIRAQAWTYENLKQKYPEVQEQLKSARDGTLLQEIGRKLRGLVGSPASSDEPIIVKEVWQLPSARFKNGRRFVYAGKLLLEEPAEFPQEYEFRGQRLFPFVHFRYSVTPNKLWGQGLMRDVIRLNKEYDKTISQILEHKNTNASGGTFYKPKDFGVSDGYVPTSVPSEVVEYRLGPSKERPWYLPRPDLGNEFEKVLNLLIHDMERITSQYEVVRGTAPPNIRSGVGLSILEETAFTQLVPTSIDIESGWARLGRLILVVTRNMYTEPRTLTVVGPDKEAYVRENFTGQELGDNVDVRVELGSAMPRTMAGNRAFLMELWKEKVIEDKRKMLRLLQLSESDLIYDNDLLIHEARAKRENNLLRQGIPVPVEDHHDHEIDIVIHNRDRNLPAYEKYPPIAQQAFAVHTDAHIQQLQIAQARMAAARAAEAAQAAGEGPGTPPAPAMPPPVPPAQEMPEVPEEALQPVGF